MGPLSTVQSGVSLCGQNSTVLQVDEDGER